MGRTKKRIVIDIVLLIILLLLLVSLFFLINVVAFNYFLNFKQKLLSDFKKTTGYTLVYNKLSPGIIGNVKVYKVVINDDEGSRIDLGDLELNYSLIKFIQNKKNPLSIIEKIKLKTLSLKSSREDLFENYQKIKDKLNLNIKKSSGNIEFDNLIIEIRNSDILITDNNNSEYFVNIDNLKITLNKEIKIDCFINSKINYNKIISSSFSVRINGIIKDINLLITDLNFDFQKLEINDFRVKKQSFSLETNGLNDIKFDRINDTLPIKFSIIKKDDELKSNIQLDNLLYKDIFLSAAKEKIPKYTTLKTNLSYDFTKKLFNGDLFLILPVEKLSFLNNLELFTDLSINNNIFTIKKVSVNNEQKREMLLLNGTYNLNKNDFDIKVKTTDFELPKTNVNTEINLVKNGTNVNINSDYLLLNSVDFGKIDFYMETLKNQINFKTLKDFNGYSLDGTINYDKKYFNIIANHHFKDFTTKPIFQAFFKNNKMEYFINSEIKTNFINNKLFIDETPIKIQDEKKDEFADIKFKYENNILEIKKLDIKKYNITSNALLNFNKKPNTISAFVNYKNNQDNYDFNINSFFSNGNINLNINNELDAYINLKEQIINVKANQFKLPIQNNKFIFSTDFIFDYNKMSINNSLIEIDNIKIFKDEVGKITTGFNYSNNILALDNFIYSDKSNKITGKISLDMNLTEKFKLNGNGFLKDDNKGESYSLNVKVNDNNLDGKLYVTHIDIRKFYKDNIKGFINARCNFYGNTNNLNLKNINFDLDGDISEGKLAKTDLKGYFSIKKNEEKIFVKKVFLQLDKNRIYVNNSDITFGKDNKKIVNLKGNIYLEALSKLVKTDFSVTGFFTDLNEKGNSLNIDLSFDKITLAYLYDIKITGLEKFEQFKFNLTKNDDTFIFKNYGPKFVYLTQNKDNFVLKFYNKGETVLDSNVQTKNNNYSGNFKFTKFPINSIKRVIINWVGIEDGFLTGEIKLKGKTDYPEFYGKLNLYHGEVSLPDYLQENIVNISGVIIADKNKILVNNVNGMVRNGNAHGYGEVVFNGWNFERYYFKVNSGIVPAKYKYGPIDTKGNVAVEDFIFEGKDQFNFIANLYVDQAEVNLAALMGIGGSSDAATGKLPVLPINVYIKFKAGSKVKINYPLAKGSVKQNDEFIVKYIGLEPNVYFGGRINLSKGNLFYLNKTFKLEQCSIQFDENDLRIDPLVNLKASYRLRDSQGTSTNIYLNFNDKLLSFIDDDKIKFTSSPYKPEEEVKGLLGFSSAVVTSTQKTDSGSNSSDSTDTSNPNIDTVVNTTNYFSNAFLFSPIENSIRRATGLDTFSMNTGLFGNIIKSNSDSNLLDLMDNSSVSFGKYLSNEIYLGASGSFNKKSVDNNQFFYPLPDKNYGFNLQFMLQVELPYLTLGYSYAPLNYKDFSKADHKVSLEAGFKF
jgi:hypothetical protein